ncbi:hypothetical protein [Mucilaginibacter gotjawali]|uniref:Uncharacterized protein n=2 Tax=Mucilaginibacter gotjawali TaxID=1550579 RepID=A0A839SDZ5_9SPHI|nr:hypothetical protein [Mucilaginibacter gotjawali]MBB3055534.1 hypothetical protein [Mucilaginibacter gotjawali]BAU53186.1 hypothetical protein MgSA37_01353 [Mucilaginibacter gotjawali]
MKKLPGIFTSMFCLLCLCKADAQNDTSKQAVTDTAQVHTVKVSGYIKYLEEGSFVNNLSELKSLGLIHNRLNFKYQPDDHFTYRLEVRNRIYYGALVKDYPGFAKLVAGQDGILNLSRNWVNSNGVLFNSTIDRASAEYIKGKWDITLGRQRINWGISTVWTPNDIFNTFNYFDFDYEERPGSDAARVQYNINTSSSLDFAVSPGRTTRQNIAAMMYHFNKWDYDFQVFSGIYQQNFTGGAGWAGNIKDAGFKGEVSYFASNRADSVAVVASLSADYAFKNGIYVMLSGLYNSLGNDNLINVTQLTASTLSAKNIFPFRYTLFAETSYSFSPIFKASLGEMYSLSGNALIILPTFTYSIADNWALDLTGQCFYSQQNGRYKPLGNSVYLRVKWGF